VTLGIKVMMNLLGGDKETSSIWKEVEGRTIKAIRLDRGALHFELEDGLGFRLIDDGQSCCEARYITSDGEDFDFYCGAKLKKITMKEGPLRGNHEECDVHEVCFVEIETTKGSFSVCTHVEHNGYYGGFSIALRKSKEKEV